MVSVTVSVQQLSTHSQLCSPCALFNPEPSTSTQQCHPYTGNLNSQTSGDSQNAFLHWGDALGTDIALHMPYTHIVICNRVRLTLPVLSLPQCCTSTLVHHNQATVHTNIAFDSASTPFKLQTKHALAWQVTLQQVPCVCRKKSKW